MARKRMIDPTIWEDENFGSLTFGAKLLFIGLFSNADDEGRIRANTNYLKSTIFMYEDQLGLSAIQEYRDEVCSVMQNVKFYEVKGNEYIQLAKWSEYQKQHKDRIQESTLPPYVEDVSDNVGQVTDNVGVVKVKLVKVKLDKVKLRENKALASKSKFNSLETILDADLEEISSKYQVPLPFVRIQFEQLQNYCQSSGRKYNDYKAALRNFVLREMVKTVQIPKQRGGVLDATNI